MTLSEYQVPREINYIAAFLTLTCNLKCPYCINRTGEFEVSRHLSAEAWIRGLSRFVTRPDLPITFQGGEPTLFGGFYDIVGSLPTRIPLDLLSNGQFDVGTFISRVDPAKFGRLAPYAPIRISYHRKTMDAVDTVNKVWKLQKAGFRVGLYAVDIPEDRAHNISIKQLCDKLNIDFRFKEYLAPGHGTYRYPDMVWERKRGEVMCQTTEILISPSGHLHRCHADLYAGKNAIGHIEDTRLPDFREVRPCKETYPCNACDVKLKTDRFQIFGHSSVEITGGEKQ